MQAILAKQRVWQEIQDLKSEKSAQMYCKEWTPLHYSVFAWIVG